MRYVLPMICAGICTGFVACQSPFDVTDHVAQENLTKAHETKPSQKQTPLCQKVSQEERDEDERLELERRKWRRAGEMLEAFT